MKRSVRIGLTLLVTGLALAYLVWKVDIHEIVDTLLDADPWWFLLSVAIMIGTALPMALRWQWLMRAQRMDDTFLWLTRAYFVSYTASQVLPTSIGGDAMRVYETARRHPGRTADITSIILLERGLGGAGTVLLGAIGFVLAIGEYDVSAYLWLEGAFVLGTILLVFVFFARSRGHRVTAILSARTPELLMSVEEMRRDGADVMTVTDLEGTSDVEIVEDMLQLLYSKQRLGGVYVCGSNRLMLAAQRVQRRLDLFGEVALEQQMACGLGMCFCCVRPFRQEDGVVHRRVCREGPVFPLLEAMQW